MRSLVFVLVSLFHSWQPRLCSRFHRPPVDLPAGKEARRSNLGLITAVLSKRQHQRNKTARFQTPLSFLLAEPEVCGLAG